MTNRQYAFLTVGIPRAFGCAAKARTHRDEPMRNEVPSIEDLQGIVEKLRVNLKDKEPSASPES